MASTAPTTPTGPGYSGLADVAQERQLRGREAHARAGRQGARRRDGRRHRRAEDRLPAAPEVDALRAYLQPRRQAAAAARSAGQAGGAAARRTSSRSRSEWGIDDRQQHRRRRERPRPAASARTQPVPIAMPLDPPHPITRDFRQMTAFPLARSVTPIEGGVDGKIAQKLLETSPQQLGRDRPQGAVRDRQGRRRIPTRATRPGRSRSPRRVSRRRADAPRRRRRPTRRSRRRRVVVVGDSDFASNGAIGIRRQPRPRS